MKTIVKDLVKRKEIELELIAKFAAIAEKTKDPSVIDTWKPIPEYPFYVTYLKEAGGPYVIGFETVLNACLFLVEIKQQKDVYDASICESYPWEVMASGSKKSASKKSKPKKS